MIKITFFCLFCLLSSSLSGTDFQSIYNDFRQGKYCSLLEEYETLTKTWLEGGRFDDFLENRHISAREEHMRLQKEVRFKKQWAKQLKKIEEEKNNALQYLCDRYPNVAITQIIRDILHYHQLREKYEEAMEFFRCLKIGSVDFRDDPVVLELQEILFDNELQTLVISSQVIDCQINSETAYFHKTLIDLKRNLALCKVCKVHPESYAAKKCLKALEVQMAAMPVVLNQQYLSDLLVGLRAPLNVVEDQTKRILHNAHTMKSKLN